QGAAGAAGRTRHPSAPAQRQRRVGAGAGRGLERGASGTGGQPLSRAPAGTHRSRRSRSSGVNQMERRTAMKYLRKQLALLPLLWLSLHAGAEVRLDTIKLPPGFSISLFAELDNPRSLTLGTDGTLFVGTRSAGKVYAIEHDGKRAQRVHTLASG